MPTYAQLFCSLHELDDDLGIMGSEREGRVFQKIKAASDFLAKEIGWFLPVTLARTLAGSGKEQFFIPPLISADSIVDDGNTLVADTDYYLRPDQPHWPNGPYNKLDVGEDATLITTWCTDKDGVVITGDWGLYNKTELLSAVIGTGGQAADATSLLVTNGKELSPGCVLLIGSEWELITSTGDPTDSAANLNGAVTAVEQDAVITVNDGTKVNVGEIIRVGLEQMKVLDKATHDLYVRRGWNRTIISAHNDATDVYVYRTFNVTRAVNGSTAAAHNAAVAIYRQIVPDDINFLCRQVAGKMLKLAQSGFMGKVGDNVTGEAIYNFAIPKDELERIKALYMIPEAV